MKKLLALMLVICMALGLCACQSSDQKTEENKETVQTTAAPTENGTAGTLFVGYGRANLTPSYSVPLAGYGNTTGRMSQGFLDYIYATCIAVTDGNDSTVLLITTDLIAMQTFMLEQVRSAVTEATGIPAERIMIQGTHTHSGPDLYVNSPEITRYKQDYIAGIAKSAEDALADRSPATMHTAVTYPKQLNFVRHYTVSDGTVYGDNFGSLSGGVMDGHTSEADNQLQLIVFKREVADKRDIVAINWQGHPKMASTAETAHGMNGRAMISSDYVGAVRDYVEKNTDCQFAFYLGASGNLNAFSKIPEENLTDDHKVYGTLLGEYVVEAMENTTAVEGTAVTAVQRMYEAKIDKTEDHLYQDALKIQEVWAVTNSYSESLKAAPDSGIISPYHAGAIISRHNNNEGVRKIEINAISIGSVGFVTAPYEMFDMNAMFVKENSPFETTFVLTCANGGNAYIAAEDAFKFNNGTGSYEVHNRTFVRGTAEDLANNFVEMLKELNG